MRHYMALALIAYWLVATGDAGAATGWERLGSRDVDFGRDRDSIQVGKSEGRFKQLQIRVKDAPIEIYDMVVVFGNDEKFSPKLKERFAEGTGSKTIDLPGDRRAIKRIDFRYKSVSRREGKGRVDVYAR